MLLGLVAGRFKFRISRSLLIAGIAFIAMLIGSWIARAEPWGLASTEGAGFAIVVVIACAGVSASLPDDRSRSAIAWGWAAAAVGSAIAAALQYAGVERWLHGAVAPTIAHQAVANLRQKNQLASLLAIGLASIAWLMAFHPARKLLLLGCGAIVCAGLALTASRTGIVEFAALCALWFVWRRSSPRAFIWLAIAAATYVLAIFAAAWLHSGSSQDLAPLLARLAGDAPDCQGRRVLWSSVIELIRDHPWSGIGWGEFPLAMYSSAHVPHFCALVENAHDLPLHIAVELGVPAAIVFVVAIAGFAWKLEPWREQDRTKQLGWAVIAVLVVHSALEYPLWYSPFQAALGLALGFAAKDLHCTKEGKLIPLVAALAMSCIVAIAAWEYARVTQLFMPPQARWASLRQDPFDKLGTGLVYRDQIAFARLMVTPVTPQTAETVFDLSGRLMHFSPEPRVIERRIESALILGRAHEAKSEAERYSRAYPVEWTAWKAAHPM